MALFQHTYSVYRAKNTFDFIFQIQSKYQIVLKRISHQQQEWPAVLVCLGRELRRWRCPLWPLKSAGLSSEINGKAWCHFSELVNNRKHWFEGWWEALTSLSTQAGLCSLTFAAAPNDVKEVPLGLPPPIQTCHTDQPWQKFWPISLRLENVDSRGFQTCDEMKIEFTVSHHNTQQTHLSHWDILVFSAPLPKVLIQVVPGQAGGGNFKIETLIYAAYRAEPRQCL